MHSLRGSHDLISINDEMTGLMYKWRAVHIIYLDFTKASNTLREADEADVVCIENLLNSRVQRVVIRGMKPP